MSGHSGRIEYRADIDGLRAISVLVVVGFHAFPNWVRGGFVGVDVFFVISGYLITSVILEGLSRDSFSFREFYGRRARRLLPALIPVLLACLALGWLLMTPPEFVQLGKHVVAAATFSSNFVLRSEAGYFDLTAALKPLLHLWSLGIEEQFYIVWPVVLLLTWKRRHSLWPVIVFCGALSFAINIWLTRAHPTAAFFLPFPRAWELMLGASLAAGWRSGRMERLGGDSVSPAMRNAMAAAGLLVILLVAFAIPKYAAFPGWWAVPPTIGAFLIIAAGPAAWTNKNILASRGAVAIGLISYPIYLWHWPLLSFARIAVGQTPSRGIRIAAVVAALVLAWATSALIEKRFRRGPARHNASTPIYRAPLLVGALVVVGLLGMYAYAGAGFAARFPDAAVVADDRWPPTHSAAYETDALAERLYAGGFNGERDFFSDPPVLAASNVTAFIGDSHGNVDFVGVRGEDYSNPKLVNVGRASCLPLLGVDSFAAEKSLECQPLMDSAISWAAMTPAVTTVVLAGFYAQYLDGRMQIRGAHQAPGVPRWREQQVFSVALARTAAFLTAHGKRVVIALDVPEMPFSVSECLSRRFAPRRFRADCSVSYASHVQASAGARRAVDSVARQLSGVTVFDPDPVLCDAVRCAAKAGNLILYRDDGNHLRWSGARLVGSSLGAALARLDSAAPR